MSLNKIFVNEQDAGFEKVSISQDTITNYTDINIGDNSYPVASVNNLFSFNLFGAPIKLIRAYVNSVGGINTVEDQTNETYTLLVPVDEHKDYSMYISIPRFDDGICHMLYINFWDDFNYSNPTYSTFSEIVKYCNVNQWTDLIIPQGKKLIGVTVSWGYSGSDVWKYNYKDCAIIEKSQFYKLATNINLQNNFINNFKNSITENNPSSLSLLNQTISYITALGTTQFYYGGYVSTSVEANNINNDSTLDESGEYLH